MKKKIVIPVSICAVIFLIWLLRIILIFFIRSNDTIYNSINDYGKFESYRGYSNLAIFPDALPASANNTQYYYEEDTSDLFDNSYQIYLKCSYNATDYQAEKNRLEAIEDTYEERLQKVLLDNQNYKFPAIVAVDSHNHCFEYALLDDDNLIIHYVFLQFIDEKDLQFDKDLLPYHYINPNESTEEEGYSIYLFGYANGERYGTTRRKTVQ